MARKTDGQERKRRPRFAGAGSADAASAMAPAGAGAMGALRAERVRSFAPVARADARILVVGSMPGEESLRRGEYYGHPRNAFWRIAGALWGFDARLPYGERLESLKRAGVALWDVLGSCRREGSLDADIEDAVPNDLPGLLAGCPGVRVIGCNGGTAHAALRRFFPELEERAVRLPSTSPAAAMWTFDQKLAMWAQALR